MKRGFDTSKSYNSITFSLVFFIGNYITIKGVNFLSYKKRINSKKMGENK